MDVEERAPQVVYVSYGRSRAPTVGSSTTVTATATPSTPRRHLTIVPTTPRGSGSGSGSGGGDTVTDHVFTSSSTIATPTRSATRNRPPVILQRVAPNSLSTPSTTPRHLPHPPHHHYPIVSPHRASTSSAPSVSPSSSSMGSTPVHRVAAQLQRTLIRASQGNASTHPLHTTVARDVILPNNNNKDQLYDPSLVIDEEKIESSRNDEDQEEGDKRPPTPLTSRARMINANDHNMFLTPRPTTTSPRPNSARTTDVRRAAVLLSRGRSAEDDPLVLPFLFYVFVYRGLIFLFVSSDSSVGLVINIT
jgi:hypothetical protein